MGWTGVSFLAAGQLLSVYFLEFSSLFSFNKSLSFPSFFLLRHNAILAWEFFHHFLWPITARTLARQLPALHCIACCCSFWWRRHFVALCVNIFAWRVLQIKLQANCGLGFACLLPRAWHSSIPRHKSHCRWRRGEKGVWQTARRALLRVAFAHNFSQAAHEKKESKQISAAFILMRIPSTPFSPN